MRTTLAVLLLSAITGTAASLDELISHLRKEVRDSEAMDLMRQVYANDRYFTFPRFQSTARVLRDQMTRLGLRQAEIASRLGCEIGEAFHRRWTRSC
ncbi:MAG: hypothetical protein JNL62_13675 [Bryobacterales bacterium]|nr:hypothetical protein [Bryobacterales bacterium]